MKKGAQGLLGPIPAYKAKQVVTFTDQQARMAPFAQPSSNLRKAQLT